MSMAPSTPLAPFSEAGLLVNTGRRQTRVNRNVADGPDMYLADRPARYQRRTDHRGAWSVHSTSKARRRRFARRTTVSRHSRSTSLCCFAVTVACVTMVVYWWQLGSFRRGIFSRSGENDAIWTLAAELEIEERHLQRDISRLEATLLDKKTLLGIAPDLNLVPNHASSNKPSAREGWDVVKAKDEWSTSSLEKRRGDLQYQGQSQEDRQPQRRPLDLDLNLKASGQGSQIHPEPMVSARVPRPSGPSNGVAGQPIFDTRPVRESLEAKDSLIREPVPLIVGGTDGSGTRGVVALLQRLRVPMVVEDGGTMDIHGSPYMAKEGWPAVVRPVLQWAHGAGYDAQGAPAQLSAATINALGKLRDKMNTSAARLRKQDGEGARYVTWGFKAPVSMLLVPFFAEAWRGAKFLHVVRDGRDIAFSGNQTPVQKFYEDTFPKSSTGSSLQEAPLKAVRMWNDWNTGLFDWATKRERSGATGLDYLLLHTEDLIDPSAKFAAVKDVAEFVGSPLSDKELCCIATEGSKDMGSHTTARKERGQVTSRFGKWKAKVEDNPKLFKRLHEEGERGLRIFGYEPERSVRTSAGYVCQAEHDPSCPKFSLAAGPAGNRPTVRRPLKPRKDVKVPDQLVDTEACVDLRRHTDFKGFDLMVGNTEEHLECCQECRKANGCTHFTFDYKSGNCYLKSGADTPVDKEGLVSGTVVSA